MRRPSTTTATATKVMRVSPNHWPDAHSSTAGDCRVGCTPANSTVAMPIPIADIPSVVMKDGIFSPVDSIPLARPKHAPSPTAAAIPRNPRSMSLRLFATSRAAQRADAAITPSIERSIAPSISTNVSPTAMTASTAAESRMLRMFAHVPNWGLSIAKTPQSSTSAAAGPKSASSATRRGLRVTAARPGSGGASRVRAGSTSVHRPVDAVEEVGALEVGEVDRRLEVLCCVLGGDEGLLSVEGTLLFAELADVELSGQRAVAHREADAALPRAVARDGGGHGAVGDGLDGLGHGVDADHRDRAGEACRLEGLERAERHVVVRRPDALDRVAVLGEQRHVGVLGERLLESDEAVFRRAGVEDALQRDDAALAAHALEHRLRDLVARALAVEGDVGDPGVVAVPRVEVGRLVPVRHEVGARSVRLLHDRGRVGIAVREHVQDHALGVPGAEGLAQLLLLLGRFAVVGEAGLLRGDRGGERVAAVEPGLLVRVR